MDDLDQILSQAKWPEPSEQSLHRLQESWQEISAASVRRRMIIGWISLAASVLLAIGIVGFLARSRPQVKLVAVRPIATAPVTIASSARKVTVREPTLRERLAIAAVMPPPTVSPAAQIDGAIKDVQEEPAAIASAAKKLREMNQPALVERRLIEQAQNVAEKKLAAIELLSEVGSVSSLPVLLQQDDSKLAQAAMPGICRLASAETLAELVRKQPRAELRRQLLTALVSRRDGDSLQRYLNFVRDAAYRGDAVVALRAMPNPPVDALLAEFDHSQMAYRFAAATAIGGICHGNVTPLLLQMVDRGNHRREALAALTLCHDPAAEEFLASANASIRSEIQVIKNEMANQL